MDKLSIIVLAIFLGIIIFLLVWLIVDPGNVAAHSANYILTRR